MILIEDNTNELSREEDDLESPNSDKFSSSKPINQNKDNLSE